MNAGYKVYTTHRRPAADRRESRAAHRPRSSTTAATAGAARTNKVELAGSENAEELEALLDEYGSVGMLQPGGRRLRGGKAGARVREGRGLGADRVGRNVVGEATRQRARAGAEPKTPTEIVARGDVVYVVHEKARCAARARAGSRGAERAGRARSQRWRDHLAGRRLRLFRQGQGKFNRVTQAKRQPGSGFKPFMYSAAMEDGFTPASVLLDAPIIMDDPNLEEVWRPENSGGGFRGPTRLREALVRSRNLVSIRLLRADGRASP